MRKFQLEDLRSTQCANAEQRLPQRKYKEDKKFKIKKMKKKEKLLLEKSTATKYKRKAKEMSPKKRKK
jgi:hypothetical protein